MRTLTKAAVAVVGALLLAGCSFNFNANRTISPDSLAQAAAEILQAEVGMTDLPDIDCGDDYIDLVAGETVVCDYTFDGAEGIYDATITITDVDGDEYGLTVQIASEPR